MTAIPAGTRIVRRDLARHADMDGWPLLSAAERRRADRFAQAGDRRRFVAGRAMIRNALGPMLGREPGDIAIQIDAHGKPWVAGAPGFSVSHAGDHVLLALAAAGTPAIGIDIEPIRSDIDPLALARHICATEELAVLRAAHDRAGLFFRLWTLKEAVLKAAGTGLLADPRMLAIDLSADPPTILYAPPAMGQARCAILPTAPGHAAALAWLIR